MSDDAKTTLLGAALHYNNDLRKEVEEWVRNMIRLELNMHMSNQQDFERMHINHFTTFKRLLREALKQDFDALRNSGL